MKIKTVNPTPPTPEAGPLIARTVNRPATSSEVYESEPVSLDDEIMCPLTGELIAVTDVDGLCEMYEQLKPKNDAIYATMCAIRRALADLTTGDAATRRVRGEKHVAKIELSAVSFEQTVLKKLWESYPELAPEFLKIESIGVKMAEYKKLENTASDNPQFSQFRDSLTKANQGRNGLPKLTIEK